MRALLILCALFSLGSVGAAQIRRLTQADYAQAKRDSQADKSFSFNLFSSGRPQPKDTWILESLDPRKVTVSLARTSPKPGSPVIVTFQHSNPTNLPLYPAIVRVREAATHKVLWWSSVPPAEHETTEEAVLKGKPAFDGSSGWSRGGFYKDPGSPIRIELVYCGVTQTTGLIELEPPSPILGCLRDIEALTDVPQSWSSKGLAKEYLVDQLYAINTHPTEVIRTALDRFLTLRPDASGARIDAYKLGLSMMLTAFIFRVDPNDDRWWQFVISDSKEPICFPFASDGEGRLTLSGIPFFFGGGRRLGSYDKEKFFKTFDETASKVARRKT